MRRGVRLALLAGGSLAAALGGLTAWGLAEAVADPIERTASLALPGLPQRAAPYKVAVLSDIHIGNRAMDPDRLARIVAQVNGEQPDLVLILGDFVNGKHGRMESDPEDLVGPLTELKASDGVVATLGNHDHWTDPAAVTQALEEAGITVLSNQAVSRGPLLLLGLDDGHTGHADIAATLNDARGKSGVGVALTHSPDLAPNLPGGVNLLLAGHTHCGQVVLPGIGSLAPLLGFHVYEPRYECGAIADGGRTVIVTAGLGSGGIPVRIGAEPDWWLLRLTAPREL